MGLLPLPCRSAAQIQPTGIPQDRRVGEDLSGSRRASGSGSYATACAFMLGGARRGGVAVTGWFVRLRRGRGTVSVAMSKSPPMAT